MAEQLPITNLPARLREAEFLGTVRLLDGLPEGVEAADCYASKLRGTCLEPVIPDGVRAIVCVTLEAKNGDLAFIWLKGHDEPLMKRLVMMPPPVALGLKPGGNVTVVVIADQFNPPRTYQFPVDKIEAVHPVIAIAPVDSDLAVPIAD